MKIETGYAPVAGGRLYYEVAGQGRPLILIHAGIANCRMWDDQLVVFAQKFRVARYDTRGNGRTQTEGVEFSNRQDIRDLMKYLGIERASLIGVSRGGQIATDLTLESPEMVERLILVAAGLGGMTGFEPPEAERGLFEELEKTYEAKDWDKLAEMEIRAFLAGPRRTREQVDAAVWARVLEMNRMNFNRNEPEPKPIVLDPSAAGRLGEIKQPTLVIVGEYDTAGTLFAYEALVKGITGAQKAVIKDAAHLPNMEKPEEFNWLVLDFLGAV